MGSARGPARQPHPRRAPPQDRKQTTPGGRLPSDGSSVSHRAPRAAAAWSARLQASQTAAAGRRSVRTRAAVPSRRRANPLRAARAVAARRCRKSRPTTAGLTARAARDVCPGFELDVHALGGWVRAESPRHHTPRRCATAQSGSARVGATAVLTHREEDDSGVLRHLRRRHCCRRCRAIDRNPMLDVVMCAAMRSTPRR
mmetsp:Transcript_81178/g.243297  ORF Transcript_81178/g.243297 Transcript_81178/m.243297 type:complete len:200 (+) Transcript_81178:791-1390(+)